METFSLTNDVRVFGKRVINFPMGITEAYDLLVQIVPNALQRSYYGLSHMALDGSIVYYATVEEGHDGEAKLYDLDNYVVEKGDYITATVLNWYTETDSITEVFRSLMVHPEADLSHHCVEWYKSDYEMQCMVRKRS